VGRAGARPGRYATAQGGRGGYGLDLNASDTGVDEPALAGHSHPQSDSHTHSHTYNQSHSHSHSHSHRGLDLNSEAPGAWAPMGAEQWT